VAQDWKKPHLASITITDQADCLEDFPVPVFERQWEGTDLGCDCLGVGSKWIKTENQMVHG